MPKRLLYAVAEKLTGMDLGQACRRTPPPAARLGQTITLINQDVEPRLGRQQIQPRPHPQRSS